MTEADTCRELVTPRLVEAGWGAAESVIGKQHSFTNGPIIVAGGKVRRGKQRRAELLTRVFLRPTQDGLGIDDDRPR
jgi:type I restriction enzyme R subunit